MKIAIVDVETTGLDECFHEIIEIGAVIFDDQTFEILDTVDIKIKPEHPDRMMRDAQRLNGYNPEEWEDAMTLNKAMLIFTEKTRGAIFCAQNMIFDWEFIKEASRKTKNVLRFHYRRLDIPSMAWAKLPSNSVKSVSLKALCAYFEVDPEPEMHRALNGAMAEFGVYKKLNPLCQK